MNESIEKYFNEVLGIDDPELMRELFGEYCTAYRDFVDKITAALEQADYDQLYRNGHSLKGCAFNMGHTAAGELALEVEKGAKEKDLAICRNYLEKLKQEAELLAL